jgi:hypothetical protein
LPTLRRAALALQRAPPPTDLAMMRFLIDALNTVERFD